MSNDLLDFQILGSLSDEIESVEDQCDISNNAIIEMNKISLYNLIDKRTTLYELNYFIDQLRGLVDTEYWISILKQIIKVYSLNPLKNLLYIQYDVDVKSMCIRLLRFIKIELIGNLGGGELKDIISKINHPKIIDYILRFIDLDSLKKFTEKIDEESKKIYSE